MVGGALSRVIRGRMNVIFRNLLEYNCATNNIKGACIPSTRVGNHIFRKSPLPQSLLPSYSRCFSIGATNHNHISKEKVDMDSNFPLTELSDDSDSDSDPRYYYLDPDGSLHELKELNRTDRDHCLAKPLVQIFSVCIHTDFGDENKGPCEIYGLIQAAEEQGVKLNVYDRDQAHSEPMNCNHGNLTLNSPEGSWITCNENCDTTLDVHIKDKTRDMVLVKGKHILYSKAEEIEDSCDKLIKAIIRSEHGFLSLYYTIFRFGIVANVAVKIPKRKHDASRCFVNVHGSIVAGYADAEKYCDTNDEVRYMKTSLFKKPADQPVQTLVDTYIELSRCAVVVPSYSTLKIQVQLSLSDSHGQFAASGSAEFPTHNRGFVEEQIEGESGGSILVEVVWNHAYMPIGELIDCHDIEDWPTWGRLMMEVFSVYVDGLKKSHLITALCGEIIYCEQLLFQRDLSDPELLPENKSMITSLNCNSPLNENRIFSIFLYLKDPLLGIEVSNGHVSWCEPTLSGTPLYNQGLCSVVPGMHGYAAVYYTILDNACQAIMGVTFLSNYASDVTTDMYGCIVARYGDDYDDYSTNYQKKYYQSRLFDVSQAESLQLTANSEIPLSKYIVAVPVDSSLVIEADLRTVVDQEDEAIVGVIKFDEVRLSHTYRKQIRARSCCIEVFVKFKDAHD